MAVQHSFRPTQRHQFDFVVAGGGVAGVCAAIAAARHGCRTALVQDRPVLGGNSSSEIRVPPASPSLRIPWAVETGILLEMQLEERWRNHAWTQAGHTNSNWDLVLYEWVTREPNLTLFLNASVREVAMDDEGRIQSLTAIQLGNEQVLELTAPLYCDATGDGVVAFQAGVPYHFGREARSEFDEPGAPEIADDLVLPSTVLIQARDMGYPVPFRAPKWAANYPDESMLTHRGHRDPAKDEYLWIEIGNPFNTLVDNEAIRDELLKHALGAWDHIKNHCVDRENAANWALEWVGSVVGKRETRRFEGDYWLREQDVTSAARFEDAVAYGGWYVDHHNPKGLNAAPDEPWSAGRGDVRRVVVHPYAIPYRTLYARRAPNLFLGGRSMSATHMALGSIRLQPTLAVCGQAIGVAAGLCREYGLDPREIGHRHLHELQQRLIRDDCFLPGIAVDDAADLAPKATATASSSAALSLLPTADERELVTDLAMLFPISADHIESVSLALRSTLDHPATIQLTVRAAANCWDFSSTEDLATASATLSPNSETDLTFQLGLSVAPHAFYWICVRPVPGVYWKNAESVPNGCVAAWRSDIGMDFQYHEKQRIARAMRVEPPCHPFTPENVLASPGRPETWPNCWVSEPGQAFSQQLTLTWSDPIRADCVEILFDSNLTREFRYMEPLQAPPEVVSEYEIQANTDGVWRTLLHETENRVRYRVHRFPTEQFDALRLVVKATWGDPAARVYAVRVYADGK